VRSDTTGRLGARRVCRGTAPRCCHDGRSVIRICDGHMSARLLEAQQATTWKRYIEPGVIRGCSLNGHRNALTASSSDKACWSRLDTMPTGTGHGIANSKASNRMAMSSEGSCGRSMR
jgi:hypothetical protein